MKFEGHVPFCPRGQDTDLIVTNLTKILKNYMHASKLNSYRFFHIFVELTRLGHRLSRNDKENRKHLLLRSVVSYC